MPIRRVTSSPDSRVWIHPAAEEIAGDHPSNTRRRVAASPRRRVAASPGVELAVDDVDRAEADPDLVRQLLGRAIWSRSFEEYVLELAGASLVHGPAHSSIGQEGGAVGSILPLRSDDVVNGSHLAVAIASPRGLVTPVLRGVESMTPSAISARVKAFVAQAADGTLRQHDLEGGVATISNLGMYGIDDFAAIINPPQSLILAVGAARPTPVVRDGAVVAATTLTLTLSADHRAIDGALAAQWLAQVVTALEHPLRLLT